MAGKKERAIRLGRPLALLDLETTGRWPEYDRIVHIAVLKVNPKGRTEEFNSLVNPEMKIPREATKVHGITNRHVKGKPTFKMLAPQVLSLLSPCDLAGFNILRFDLVLLQSEFSRAGVQFDVSKSHVIDVMKIFHAQEPRNLSAAYRHYCGKEHRDAHSPQADARVCWEILQAMVKRHGDLPPTPEGLGRFCAASRAGFMDSGEWFERRDARPVFAKSKYRGRPLAEVAQCDSGFLEWMLSLSDLPDDTRRIVAKYRKGMG